MSKKKQIKSIKVFDPQPEDQELTVNDVKRRLDNMRAVGEFKCENEKHRKARYALVKNLERYEAAIARIRKTLEQPSEEFKKYQDKKVELLKECGAVLESHPELGSYYSEESVKDRDQFRSKLRFLEDDYRDVLEEERLRQKRNDAVGDYVVEDVPESYMTRYEYFPDEISPTKLASISFMLQEEDPAPVKNPKPKEE